MTGEIPFDPDMNFGKSYSHSGSGENLFDYYKLNKLSEDKKLILKPVDLSSIEHGEDFKAYETISSDDSLNKNITQKTSEVLTARITNNNNNNNTNNSNPNNNNNSTYNKDHEHNEDSANDETIAESDYDGEPKSLESLLKLKDTTKLNSGLTMASPPARYANINVRNSVVNPTIIDDEEITTNKEKSSNNENNNNTNGSSTNNGETDDNEKKTAEQIKYFYQPIERMTVEDFFDNGNDKENISQSATTNLAAPNSAAAASSAGFIKQATPPTQKSSLDELKAKFERKDPQADEHLKRAKPEDLKSFNLKDGKSVPAKLPKSKMEIYDSQKSELTTSDTDLKSSSTKKTRFNAKKPSNDDKQLEISDLPAKPDKPKLTPRTTSAEKSKEKSELTEFEDKRSKLRKTPHIYPIEDEPKAEKHASFEADENLNKLSSEDEFSVYKRPSRSSAAAAFAHSASINTVAAANPADSVGFDAAQQQPDLSKLDKGVKSLLNVYEKNVDITTKNDTQKVAKLKADDGRDLAENVKKLPKSTVSLFDKKDPPEQPEFLTKKLRETDHLKQSKHASSSNPPAPASSLMKEAESFKSKETTAAAADNKQNKQSASQSSPKETDVVKSILLPKMKKDHLQSMHQMPDQEEAHMPRRNQSTVESIKPSMLKSPHSSLDKLLNSQDQEVSRGDELKLPSKKSQNDEPKKLSKTKLEIYEPKGEEEPTPLTSILKPPRTSSITSKLNPSQRNESEHSLDGNLF